MNFLKWSFLVLFVELSLWTPFTALSQVTVNAIVEPPPQGGGTASVVSTPVLAPVPSSTVLVPAPPSSLAPAPQIEGVPRPVPTVVGAPSGAPTLPPEVVAPSLPPATEVSAPPSLSPVLQAPQVDVSPILILEAPPPSVGGPLPVEAFAAPVYSPPVIPSPELVSPSEAFISPFPTAEERLSVADVDLSLQSILLTAPKKESAVAKEEATAPSKINTFPGHPIEISIPEDKFKKSVKNVIARVGDEFFLFKHESPFYTIEISSPTVPGYYSLAIGVTYEDRTTDLLGFVVDVKRPPYIYSKGSIILEPDVTVTLYELMDNEWRIFDATPYRQQNPQRTNAQGQYAFLVPEGVYHLKAEKKGYISARTTSFRAALNVVDIDVEIIKNPPPLKLDKTLPKTIEKIAIVAARVVSREVVRIVQDPVIEHKNETVAAPVVVSGAILNAAVALPSWGLWPYLQYFFTQPTWLIGRRRRKKWGVVYNSLTKLPIGLAIVRLIDAASGQLIRTRVTDKDGRYAFVAFAGAFRIEVVKPAFSFPSRYLKGKKEDINYLDLYGGQPIQAKEGAVITVNIPIDPQEKVPIPKEVVRQYFKKRFQLILSASGIFLALVSFVVSPKITIGGYLISHIFLFVLFRRLAYPRRPKSWGIIYDEQTKKPIAHAVVRIFETQFNKLLESWPTDRHGRYSFLVGSNIYYLTSEKSGYAKYESKPIDLRLAPAVVTQDISMKQLS